MKFTVHTLAAAAALCLVAGSAAAPCGSASCSLMTDRYAQGGGEAHQGWSSDIRIESVTQTQLREGTHNISAADAQAAGEEAIERRTRNLNIVTTLDYGLADGWSVSLRFPVVKRQHDHDVVDETPGDLTPEQWRFTKVGDVQLMARKQTTSSDAQTATAWFGGLKLPTGSTKQANGDGTVAERALQPGTGTTELVVGYATRVATSLTDAAIAQVSFSAALNKSDEFRPGSRLEASVAWSHAYSPTVGTVLQLNLRKRGHDSGANAEPALSGSTTIDLSPGLTLGVSHGSTLYAYVQLPLYQKVTGIQLVPKHSLAIGWTNDF
jgi:hypothetical protein